MIRPSAEDSEIDAKSLAAHLANQGIRIKIKVNYNSRGPNWTLSVSDAGVGMPKDAAIAKSGLGTNIVQALAGQLQATITVSEAHPGTMVSMAHTQLVAVQSAASSVPGGHAV